VNHQEIESLTEAREGAFDEIIAHKELSNLIKKRNQEEEEHGNKGWVFKAIAGHVGPTSSSHHKCKGSLHNVKVLWEDNSFSVCAKENDLLKTPGWKALKQIARCEKQFNCMVQQARMQSQRNAVVCKFGVRLPCSRAEAFAFDANNGVTKWHDAVKLELDQLDECDAFIKDKGEQAHGPNGFKQINCNFVFDCKQDLRHKARLVAGGHMTAPPRDSVCSGVASLRSMGIAALLAKLNGIEMQAAGIGNACLKALTLEKACYVAGPEFWEQAAGHALVIHKALHGLKTSSRARWGEKFADTLRPCVWMQDTEDTLEHVCAHADNLATCLKDQEAFFDVLPGPKHKQHELKGVGPIKCHGTVLWGSKTCIERMLKK
jgi:hypothetical protein